MLVTRPDYDDTTSYLHAWSKSVIDVAKERGLKVLDLEGPGANRDTFESYVSEHVPSFVFFNGHGNETTIAGDGGRALVEYGVNDSVLNSRVVYARSCDSATVLGRKGVENGIKAFIGYDQKFIFYMDNSKTHIPLEDEYAKPCFEASNVVADALVRGSAVSEAVSKSKTQFRKEVERLLTEPSLEVSSVLFSLFWDVAALKFYGDPDATV
jgi:hypothetical protein